MTEAALDDVFSDDIIVPGRRRLSAAATLFLPRGAKRHAVLINSATATPRKIYRSFAAYLAQRGCAVLTYDYRGIGGSRQRDVVGYNQPKSLVGFKASMADWAALDVTAAVAWMRERYRDLPLHYVGHSFGGQALGLLANNVEVSRALLIAAQAALLEADGLARALPRVGAAQRRRRPPRPTRSAMRRAGRASARICRRTCSCNGRAG